MKSQRDRIIVYMEETGETLNPAKARYLFGIERLAARICELQKQGYIFEKGWKTGRNRYGERYKVRTYKLIKSPDTQNRLEI